MTADTTQTPSSPVPTILAVAAGDGTRFEIRLCEATVADAPLLLFWPAMGTSARYYDPLAGALAAVGVHAAMAELRGIGSSSVRAGRRVDFGYRHLLEYDWPAAVKALRIRHPDSPLWLGGHSLGGQLSVMYAARYPDDLSGLVLVACGNIHYRNWRGARRWKLLALSQLAAGLGTVLGYYPGKRVGFGGTEARTVIHDWARVIRSGRYRAKGIAFDFEAAMARLRLPALGISFDHDGLAPYRSMQSLLDKFPADDATHLHLDESQTGMHLNHFNWVRQSAPVVQHVAARLVPQN